MNINFPKILLFSLCLPCIIGYAETPGITTNILSVVDIAVTLIFNLCYATGVVLVCMSFVFFRRYRKNPVETPIGKVFWALFLGICIFILPFIGERLSIYETLTQAAIEEPSSMS